MAWRAISAVPYPGPINARMATAVHSQGLTHVHSKTNPYIHPQSHTKHLH